MGKRSQNAPKVGLYAVAFKLFSWDWQGDRVRNFHSQEPSSKLSNLNRLRLPIRGSSIFIIFITWNLHTPPPMASHLAIGGGIKERESRFALQLPTPLLSSSRPEESKRNFLGLTHWNVISLFWSLMEKLEALFYRCWFGWVRKSCFFSYQRSLCAKRTW
jgi:hypothetical protein